jgi:hypothetical protein
MGADAFIGFYGIEEVLSPDEASAVDLKTDERIARARRSKLNFHIGRITDGRDYHLLIGKKIADIGVQAGEEATYSDSEFELIQEDVRKKLREAGFSGAPKLIFKLNAQY